MPDTIVYGNSQNDATQKSVHTRSTFKLPYHSFQTMRFGDLTPHFVMECVRGDKNVKVRSAHDVRSYSLKAPLMTKIQLKKDYFSVPMECILPLNWDKIYTNPTIGDDVPSDAYTYVSDFIALVHSFLNSSEMASEDYSGLTFDQSVFHALRFLLTAELFASDGNLLSNLGIHLSSIWKFEESNILNMSGDDYIFDNFFDLIVAHIVSVLPSGAYFTNGELRFDNIREFIEYYRDNLGMDLTLWAIGGNTLVDPIEFLFTVAYRSSDFIPFGLDIARCFAYQIVCAHYYSNDFVDYIYSAELYREYIGHLFDEFYISSSAFISKQFTYNGLSCLYDHLSAHIFSSFLTIIPQGDSSLKYAYLQAVFGFKHSLRFMDYFVGSKTRPLAVGDTSVAVSGGKVSMIDTARGLMATRFYNAVNRFGRKWSNYLEGLIPDAKKVAPDYHNPFFLAHTADDIYGQEIENTNVVDQESNSVGLSIISNLRSNGSRYAFEFDADRPCIILGISYFDVPRSYYTTIERQAFHKDRFDMFNPFMQFIGDQVVYEREIMPWKEEVPFGYQLRHAEYKQRYSQASGGFVRNLPGYTFLNDYDFQRGSRLPDGTHYKISPDFIRSKNYELDRFYISLTGYSLSSYFHFIVDNYNDVSASRPMAYAPSIL